MEKKLIILVALFAICSTGNAWGGVYQWFGAELPDGTGRTDEWTSGGAWADEFGGGPPLPHGVVPTAYDKAKVNLVWGNPGPVIRTAVSAGEVFISEDPVQPAIQTVTVAAGGSLVTGTPGYDPLNPVGYAGQLNLGYYSTNTGKFIMDGGTANITENVMVGFQGKGILQMNSGTLNVNQMFRMGWAGGTGEVHLDGGLLHTVQWWGSDPARRAVHNYTFDITGGTWEIHSWWEIELQELVDNGWLTGYGSPDNVVIAWDAVRGITTVTAIPEPITLSLLGLGALLLRRRS